jgi:23S rRNA pseudouridine955/2504/2580 synthase
MRLDRWCRSHFSHLPHSLIAKALRLKKVRVDQHTAEISTRVNAGQIVTFPVAWYQTEKQEASQAPAQHPLVNILSQAILYEDEWVLILNKPPGLACQGGTGVGEDLTRFFPYLSPLPLRLVHRLDRDTSGVLMLAKTRQAAIWLAEGFRLQRWQKIYWAIVVGTPDPQEGMIDTPVAHKEEQLSAATHYKLLGSHLGISLLELKPKTGRMHQLRQHTALSLGTPILGDRRYAKQKPLHADLGRPKRHLMLHARQITITLPDGEALLIEAPLEAEMCYIADCILSQNFSGGKKA